MCRRSRCRPRLAASRPRAAAPRIVRRRVAATRALQPRRADDAEHDLDPLAAKRPGQRLAACQNWHACWPIVAQVCWNGMATALSMAAAAFLLTLGLGYPV